MNAAVRQSPAEMNGKLAETPREWLVFDSTGVLIASAETPASLDIRWIGSSSVVGISRDRLDVGSVREHAIVRHK